eukprot:CAMPEP_0119478876 /NCGR_PEP_ID=MMETSP1344-20130328/8416_1 /TAXON_ID=236787 /ORGANISM="Florenciella parvula, Strain CCMP2471" /LENGTH=40 /DNA_ID= /DNA_START= /DNA_END= /DNA_ORIENTATION=
MPPEPGRAAATCGSRSSGAAHLSQPADPAAEGASAGAHRG